jgi:acyl-CoA reductase-like NAD-dependent aldehyde dehydrogenase
MPGTQQNYIGGTWVPAVAAAPNINPSNLNDVIADYARAQPAEADAAIAAATAAFAAYSRSTPQERYEALKKISDEILARKDELGRLLSREEGKTLPEGIGEVVRAGQVFAFFAGEAVRMSGEKIASTRPGIDVEITREPVGVVALITPWNFPMAIPAWKIAPALVLWQLRGVQAGRSRAWLGTRSCRDHLEIRAAAGSLQPGHGARQRDR